MSSTNNTPTPNANDDAASGRSFSPFPYPDEHEYITDEDAASQHSDEDVLANPQLSDEDGPTSSGSLTPPASVVPLNKGKERDTATTSPALAGFDTEGIDKGVATSLPEETIPNSAGNAIAHLDFRGALLGTTTKRPRDITEANTWGTPKKRTTLSAWSLRRKRERLAVPLTSSSQLIPGGEQTPNLGPARSLPTHQTAAEPAPATDDVSQDPIPIAPMTMPMPMPMPMPMTQPTIISPIPTTTQAQPTTSNVTQTTSSMDTAQDFTQNQNPPSTAGLVPTPGGSNNPPPTTSTIPPTFVMAPLAQQPHPLSAALAPPTGPPPPMAWIPPANVPLLAVPNGGFPEINGITSDDLTRYVDPTNLDVWRAHHGPSLLAYIANDKLEEDSTAKVTRIKDLICSVMDVPTIIVGVPSYLDHYTFLEKPIYSFFIAGVTDGQRRILLDRKCWSTPDITFFTAPIDSYVTTFIVTLQNLPISESDYMEDTAATIVKNQMRDNPNLRSFLATSDVHRNHFAHMTPDHALDAIVDSVYASKLTIKINGTSVIVYNIYAIPPTNNPAALTYWIHLICGIRFVSIYGTASCREPWVCHCCKGKDHPSGLCPYAPLIASNRPLPTSLPMQNLRRGQNGNDLRSTRGSFRGKGNTRGRGGQGQRGGRGQRGYSRSY